MAAVAARVAGPRLLARSAVSRGGSGGMPDLSQFSGGGGIPGVRQKSKVPYYIALGLAIIGIIFMAAGGIYYAVKVKNKNAISAKKAIVGILIFIGVMFFGFAGVTVFVHASRK